MEHCIKNEYLRISVAEDGAQLMAIEGRDGTQYLWQGDPAYWPDRALNLFPYVARLTEGAYYLDDKRYTMDIHGIAPYRRFAVTEHTETALELTLESDDKTRESYPREFAFRIRYALEGSTLAVTFLVENRDSRTMYFGLGGHPGFCVPLAPGKEFSDYRLRFSEPCQPRRLDFSQDCFVTGTDTAFPLESGTILPLKHSMFDNDAIVLKDMARQVTLETPGDAHAVTVSFPQMRYLGLWHWPKTDAPYICIEPWCSLPSTKDQVAVLEQQADLLHLEPGNIYRNTWTIQIHTP